MKSSYKSISRCLVQSVVQLFINFFQDTAFHIVLLRAVFGIFLSISLHGNLEPS